MAEILKKAVFAFFGQNYRPSSEIRIFEGDAGNQGPQNRSEFFKAGYRESRTAESVRCFKGDARIYEPSNQFGFLKWYVGIHGPPNRSEFLKKDPRTTESNQIFKRDARIHLTPKRSKLIKQDTGMP